MEGSGSTGLINNSAMFKRRGENLTGVSKYDNSGSIGISKISHGIIFWLKLSSVNLTHLSIAHIIQISWKAHPIGLHLNYIIDNSIYITIAFEWRSARC